jgi:hypothetical protein
MSNQNDFQWPPFRPPPETYKLDYGIGPDFQYGFLVGGQIREMGV